MDLSQIKGIKEKRLQDFTSAGICTPMDLLSYFPNKYVDLKNLTDFNSVRNGDDVVFCVSFTEKPKVAYIRTGLCMVKVKFEIGNRSVYCTWFNMRYIAKSILVGVQYYVIGKAKLNGRSIDVINPKLVRRDKCKSRFLVYYKPIKKIGSAVIESAVKEILKSVSIHSFISEFDREKHGLLRLHDAYKAMHQPTDLSVLDLARRTVSIEYLSYTLSVYSIIRQNSHVEKARKYQENGAKLNEFIHNLPYELTEDQSRAITEIVNDLHGRICMNRLLQGDVGCGKTVVAMAAAYYVTLSGFQSVIMCPTELLARQHYLTAIEMLGRYGVRVGLLTSSLKAAQRKEVLSCIANGEIDVIVGTHAVFSEGVIFSNLDLVTTDEQHRFGVNQRSNLENKSEGVDCLVMSATPIPRTLALTLYGDLKQSYIKSLPKHKAEIKTKIVPEYKLNDMWRYFVECAERDERTYVVCPRIEDEDEDLISVKGLFAEKKSLYEKLAVLHGQMSDAQKDAIMSKFASGEIKILISTTVIEVGIDVPDAVNIAVYNAERYGLSQLHQLRGRVGRGTKTGYCFLIPKEECPESALDRLSFLTSCRDGFSLAEYDFEVRGAGDFLGNSQHGKSGDFFVNAENIREAKEISDGVMRDNEKKKELSLTINENKYSYFRNITLN